MPLHLMCLPPVSDTFDSKPFYKKSRRMVDRKTVPPNDEYAKDIGRKIDCVCNCLGVDDEKRLLQFGWPSAFRQTPSRLFKDVCSRLQKVGGYRDEEGIVKWLVATYIQEIWFGEAPNDLQNYSCTTEVVDALFDEKTDMDVLVSLCRTAKDPSKVAKKVRNLLSAIRKLLGSDFMTPLEEDLSVKLVQDVHAIVCKDLILDAGNFRTKLVGASGSRHVYLHPERIKSRLPILLDTIRFHMNATGDDQARVFAVAAVFFSEFLLIHPFMNGNGRTARLLLNFLLKDRIIVPFTLWGCYAGDVDSRDMSSQFSRERELYLTALNARNDYVTPPYFLAGYMLASLKRLCDTTAYLMME